MSDERLRVTTEEQHERLRVAKRRGGRCAGCDRVLVDGEPIYWQAIEVAVGRYTTKLQAPVGVECASPELLRRVEGAEPERCAHCGRPVYYGTARTTRTRPLCSLQCGTRLSAETQRARGRD